MKQLLSDLEYNVATDQLIRDLQLGVQYGQFSAPTIIGEMLGKIQTIAGFSTEAIYGINKFPQLYSIFDPTEALKNSLVEKQYLISAVKMLGVSKVPIPVILNLQSGTTQELTDGVTIKKTETGEIDIIITEE